MRSINGELAKLIPEPKYKLNTVGFFGSAGAGAVPVTTTIYDINNTDTQLEIRSMVSARAGVQINSGNAGIGKGIQEIMFPMKKTGTPPNTFRYEVYNSAGVLQDQTETKTADSLTTSFVNTVLTLTGIHTVAIDDRIVVTYDDGGISNKILLSEDNSVGSIPTNTKHTAYDGTWTESTAQWTNGKFDNSPTE